MSVTTFDPSATPITVTDRALKYFHRNAKDGGGSLIRLSVKKSGCSGFAYVLDFVDSASESDRLIDLDDQLVLAVDNEAVNVVHGTEIDLVTEGLNHVIKFNNPNVVGECGCGESFSVN